MKRRDFFKKSIGAGLVTGAALSFGDYQNLFANNSETEEAYDLIAVKGGEPDVMFDKAIESYGGIGRFVKKGQTVVVKPNIGWDKTPEFAADTNPILVKRIVQACKQAGAKDVYVFDYTCHTWDKCYKNSGIEKAVKDAGGTIVPANSEKYYQEITIPKAKKLTKEKVHELILQSDVFINVPILKHHSSTQISISMKNLMGIAWGRNSWHKIDLHQCIADFLLFKKPTLNIVDAYNVMKKNGPQGVSKSDVLTMKSLIMSTDIVAADAAAAKLFGIDPNDIPYIVEADNYKIGTKNLEKLKINRIKI